MKTRFTVLAYMNGIQHNLGGAMTEKEAFLIAREFSVRQFVDLRTEVYPFAIDNVFKLEKRWSKAAFKRARLSKF